LQQTMDQLFWDGAGDIQWLGNAHQQQLPVHSFLQATGQGSSIYMAAACFVASRAAPGAAPSWLTLLIAPLDRYRWIFPVFWLRPIDQAQAEGRL
jgi:hypothetical protein